jgi:hypothetical protein
VVVTAGDIMRRGYIAPLRDVGSTTPTIRSERPAVERPTIPERPRPVGWHEAAPGLWELGLSPLARVHVTPTPDGVVVAPLIVDSPTTLDAAAMVTEALAEMCAWLRDGRGAR